MAMPVVLRPENQAPTNSADITTIAGLLVVEDVVSPGQSCSL